MKKRKSKKPVKPKVRSRGKVETLVVIDPHSKAIKAYEVPKGTKTVRDEYGGLHFLPPGR